MTKYENLYIESLKTELPDEVKKYRMAGYFDDAIKAIDRWLLKNVSKEMNDRLEIEKEHIGLIKAQFPYSEEEALEIARKDIPDFTAEDLKKLDQAGVTEWIFVDGKKHYISSFWRTATHVVKELKDVVDPSEDTETPVLNGIVKDMKKLGELKYKTRVRLSIKLKDDKFTPGMKVKTHLPLPANMYQTSDVKILATSHTPVHVDDEKSMARTIYFEEVMEENQEFFVDVEYVTDMKYVDACALSEKAITTDYDFDVDEFYPHIVFSPYLKALSKEIVGDETNPLKIAELIYDYVTSKVNYSYMMSYFLIPQIPEYCARNLRGDCGVQALLFITLCRINGIPARWQSGLYVLPGHFGPHDWAMFYVEPFGWLFADPSFGGYAYETGDEERRWFYFGNLDPFRFCANHEFQKALNPPKKFRPSDPYDNQSGEMETDEYGMEGKDVECKRKIIFQEKI